MARVLPPQPGRAAVVRHPEHNGWESLIPGAEYDDDDPMVRAYPWAFEDDEGEPIETASAKPGTKRRTAKKAANKA